MTRLDTIRGAIFDLDGTLLDSMGMWQQIDVDFLAKRGILLPPDYQAAVTPLGAYEAAVYTIDRFEFQETPEELIAEWLEMAYGHYRDDLQLKPHALEYVRQLHGRGIPMTIATSSDRSMVEAACRRTGLSAYIPRIITTVEAGRGKEWPDIYVLSAEMMGVEPADCAVYEDIIHGVRSAKSGGFYTVGVYEPTYARLAEVQAEADRFILSFSELLADAQKL